MSVEESQDLGDVDGASGGGEQPNEMAELRQQLQLLQEQLNRQATGPATPQQQAVGGGQQQWMPYAKGLQFPGHLVTTVRGLPCLEKAMSYESYAKQIRMWAATCRLPKKSWGAKIAE